MLLFSPLVDRRVSLLASRAVYVTSRYATRPGARYSYRGYEQWAIALLEFLLIEVVYRTKSAYGITISAASFALGGSSNCSEMEPSKVQKLELKQGTKLQLASFDSTRLKGEGLSNQQVEEFLLQKKS